MSPQEKPEDKPTDIAFFLCPGFASIGFVCALEVLRAANKLSGRQLYCWHVMSASGGLIASNNDLETMTDEGPVLGQKYQSIIIVSGTYPDRAASQKTRNRLRDLARHGVSIGGISTGAWVMAQAGLLEGYKCAIHWENAASFAEEYPTIELTRGVFEIDRDRYTCAGGTSSMDMMLQLVARDHGHNLATQIANFYQHERIRGTGDLQSEARHTVIKIKSEKLLRVINVMENNVEQPLDSAELAVHAGITPRQLQRLFKEHTGYSPNRYYLDLRLRHARLLLLQTAMPVIDVAVAAGFVSHAHFSKCYRQLFGVTPTEERRRAF